MPSDQTPAQDTWDYLLCEVDEDGHRRWYDENGKLHREDGPAFVRVNGTQYWCRHGMYHRVDGPAIITVYGSRHWFKHGKRHREDGPAVIWPSGRIEYWIDGEYLARAEIKSLANSNVT